MKTKHTLMLLAASLATTTGLHAQTAAPDSMSAVLQQLAATPKASALTPEQRAAKLGVLALIPSDAESFVAVPHFADSIANLMSAPLLQMAAQGKQQDILKITGMVKSIAIATGPGSSEAMGRMLALMPSMAALNSPLMEVQATDMDDENDDSDIDDEKQEEAEKNRMERMQKSSFESSRNSMRRAADIMPALLQATNNCSTLAVAELDPSAIASIDPFLMQAKQGISNSDQVMTWHEGTYAGRPWKGCIFDGKNLVQNIILPDYKKYNVTPDAAEQKVINALAATKFYYLCTVQDNKLIISFCSDPAKDIKIAASPKESILSTSKVAFADARLDKNPDLLYSLDKAFAEGASSGLLGLGSVIPAPARTPQITALLKSVSDIAKLSTPDAMTGLLWADKGIHFETTQGATAALDLNSPLQLLKYADRPETILYGECNYTSRFSALMVQMVENAASATHTMYNMIHSTSMGDQPSQPQPVPPQLLSMWQNVKTALSGMDGKTALLVDNKGKLPEILVTPPVGDPAMKNIAIPRIALYKGVANRLRISMAWDKMYASAKELYAQAGGMPELKQAEKNGISTYGFVMPKLPAAAEQHGILIGTPVVLLDTRISISDKAWVIGSSSGYTYDIARAAATGTSELKGAAFAFRLAPIKDMVDKNAPLMKGMMPGAIEQVQTITALIASQIDGIYGTTTAEGNKTRSHLYLRTK
ncbi:hypothetical protein [Akkermansia glycaniphila]|nr:hypothetical protein [Akkermansia glycaniphila]